MSASEIIPVSSPEIAPGAVVDITYFTILWAMLTPEKT